MDFKIDIHDDIIVFRMEIPRATVEVSGKVKEALLEKISDTSNRIIFDLAKVEFVDSSFLGVLVAGLKRATMNNGDLKIISLQPPVQSMFELTRLYRIFDIFDNEQEAIKSF
jgi:anti-sigma B factor antagonist